MITSRSLSSLSIIIVLAVTVFWQLDGIKASNPDCDSLSTILEKTVCKDQSLNELGIQLTQAYTELVQSISQQEVENIENEQLIWLKNRAGSCPMEDIICLRGIYVRRIERLKTILSDMVAQAQSASTENEMVSKKINDTLPPLEFKIFWKEREAPSDSWEAPHGEISMVQIYSTKPYKSIQRIINPDRNYSIFFEDYNFDGYLDFRLTLSGMLLGNIFSDVYIFDPKAKKYNIDVAFSDLASISVDSEKRLIYSNSRSARGLSFTYQILTVANNQLVVLLKRTSDIQIVDGEIYLFVSEKTFDADGRINSQREKKVKENELRDEHFPLETIPLSKLP